MSKRKLQISLVSGVVGLLALTGCSGLKSDDKYVVDFKGYDGQQLHVITNSVYNEYRRQTDGISKFYNAVLETVVRFQFDDFDAKNKDKAIYKKTLAQIKDEAATSVKNAKEEADENHTTNGTSYDTEWENILAKYGVEDEDQLLQHFIYDIEKTELTDQLYNVNKLNLVKEFIGVDANGKSTEKQAKGVFPYHIKHVLSKVSGGGNAFYNGEISVDEAKHLANTMKALVDPNYTFTEVASEFSEDNEGDKASSKRGGDLGIMSTTTSFVNEFKLGIYAYDAIYNHGEDEGDAKSTIYKGLGLDQEITYYNTHVASGSKAKEVTTTVAEYFQGNGVDVDEKPLEEVPYGAFLLLDTKENGGYADVELDDNSRKVNNGNVHYYPRNIIWNYYLNKHQPFVITNKKLTPNDDTHAFDEDVTENAKFNAQGYLTDGKGNIIIGVRSEHGIHFMAIEKSIFDLSKGGKDNVEASLEEYYTTYVPGDYDANSYEKSYPYYMKDGKRVDKKTYVNFINTNVASVYTDRANEVKNAVKSFDANYDYRLFQKYESDGRFTFNKSTEDNVDLKAVIDEYISSSIKNSSATAYKSLKDSWKTYIELLEVQNENRIEAIPSTEDGHEHEATNSFRLIPTRCAVGFHDKSKDKAFEKGGMCYYED